MTAYYNENNKYCALWLENLIKNKDIVEGVVDSRSLLDVKEGDLQGFLQAHFFAGIGGWSAALRLASWPDDCPIWTGSCPCQPFSASGKQKGFNDERHLWPIWFTLIKQCKPPIIVGEQVSSKPALEWLDAVSTDLEREGYAIGAADLCAAGIGAPHLRNRLYWVAYLPSARLERPISWRFQKELSSTSSYSVFSDLANSNSDRFNRERLLLHQQESRYCPKTSWSSKAGFWDRGIWHLHSDGKKRQIEPESFPLVDGVSFKLGSGSSNEGKNRKEMIKAYGNAIVVPLAATFVSSIMEILFNEQSF